MMGKFSLILISIFVFHLEESFGNPALPPLNEEPGNSITIQELMVQLAGLKENFDRDALLTFFTSVMDEITRLTKKNHEYEARLNQLETIQGLASQSQQEQHILPSPSNEIKQSKAMPSHCEDVRASGNLVSNGFYTVKGSTGKTIETIYCDFSFLPGSEGYETRIGYIDIKTSPVYFYVQRNAALSANGVVTFDLSRLNTGGAMNLGTGVFTAPRPGTYFFTFTAIHADDSNNGKPFYVEIQLNGVAVGNAWNWIEGSSKDDIPATLQATLQLKTNDRITMYKSSGLTAGAHFTGMLLEEELSL